MCMLLLRKVSYFEQDVRGKPIYYRNIKGFSEFVIMGVSSLYQCCEIFITQFSGGYTTPKKQGH